MIIPCRVVELAVMRRKAVNQYVIILKYICKFWNNVEEKLNFFKEYLL